MVQKASAEMKKPTVAKREDVYNYRPILCNFEYGDAADTFIEDEWNMLVMVARYRPTCSMPTGRLVIGQFRCDACMPGGTPFEV